MYFALSKVTRMVGSVSYERGVTTVVDQFCMSLSRGRPAEYGREKREQTRAEQNNRCFSNASLSKREWSACRFEDSDQAWFHCKNPATST